MITVRPTEPEDIPALRRLGACWEVGDDEALAEEITRGDVGAARFVAVDGAGAPVACARVTLLARPRLRHRASVDLATADEASATRLLDHLAEVVFRRMGQGRMDVASADPTLDAALTAAGFTPWVHRVGGWRRAGHTRDLVTWGRLAPGWVPGPVEPRRVPRRAEPRLTDLVARPARPEDAPAWTANQLHPGVMWGTHQVGTNGVATWRRKLAPRPGGRTWVVEQGGTLLAHGAVDHLPGDRAHVMTLGISVAAEAQGRGAGDVMMAALIGEARSRGAARVELQVYADNERAEALYLKHGFVVEGDEPFGAWREGGWAWDRHMALRLDASAPGQLPLTPSA